MYPTRETILQHSYDSDRIAAAITEVGADLAHLQGSHLPEGNAGGFIGKTHLADAHLVQVSDPLWRQSS